MTKNIIAIFFLFLLIPSIVVADREDEAHPEYMIKTAYIVKFIKFIKFPEKSSAANPKESFRVYVIGKNPFGTLLEKNIKIKNRKVTISVVEKVEDVENAAIIFISASESKRVKQILALTEGKPILTISDSEGLAKKGVLINFYNRKNDYLGFEVNIDSVKKSKIKFNSKVFKIARIIRN